MFGIFSGLLGGDSGCSSPSRDAGRQVMVDGGRSWREAGTNSDSDLEGRRLNDSRMGGGHVRRAVLKANRGRTVKGSPWPRANKRH